MWAPSGDRERDCAGPKAARYALGVLVAAAALAAVVGLASDTDTSKRVTAYPTELPAGPGSTIAEERCIMCHAATLITQQRKDSTGWEKTLTQMEKWSEPVPPPQRDSLKSYLLARFGPGSRPQGAAPGR